MADLGHDAVFVEEAAALRPRLERCARVLYPGVDGGARQADRVVDQALARTYALPVDADRTTAAFAALLHPAWRTGRGDRADRADRTVAERVELLDVTPIHTGGLADDLAALGSTSQAVVVLLLLGALTLDDVGRVMGAPALRITELFTDAVARLADRDPSRSDPAELTRQLAGLAGAADPGATTRAGVGDLARGRRFQQRGRHRRAVLAACAAVVVALVVGLGIRAGTQVEIANAPPPAPRPTPSQVSDPPPSGCSASDQDCRAQVLMRWRSAISGVVVDQLDPDHRYFSSMSWQVRPTDESAKFWRGDGGALALGLSRFTDGGTEVYLQIATAAEYADRCGQRTKQRCTVLESMDGNSYLVAGTSAADGVEVQYRPDQNRVITVVARNTSDGKKLDIDSGDLIRLVRDSRLRLPSR